MRAWNALSPSAIVSALVVVERPASERLHELHAGKRILLAEDEPSTQLVARELLEVVGLVVDVAVNGERALDLAGQKPYALILMAVQMPALNGLKQPAPFVSSRRTGKHRYWC